MVIFFDWDDTLLDHGHASRVGAEALFRQFPSSSLERFQAAWREAQDTHFPRFARGEISFVEHRVARMRHAFSDPEMPADLAVARFEVYSKHYKENWRLFDDVMPCLDRLQGYPLGIISNGKLTEQSHKLERMGLAGRFATVVISEEVGVGKPAPAVFLEACRRIGAQPADCVYVGDAWENDVIGSRAVGMTPVWLNRENLPVPDPSVRVIHSLHDLCSSAFIRGYKDQIPSV
jgi:putative hydrolase of the HAD superfamily